MGKIIVFINDEMKNKEKLSISPLDEKKWFFWLKSNKTRGILTQSLPYNKKIIFIKMENNERKTNSNYTRWKKWFFSLRSNKTKETPTLSLLNEKKDYLH